MEKFALRVTSVNVSFIIELNAANYHPPQPKTQKSFKKKTKTKNKTGSN